MVRAAEETHKNPTMRVLDFRPGQYKRFMPFVEHDSNFGRLHVCPLCGARVWQRNPVPGPGFFQPVAEQHWMDHGDENEEGPRKQNYKWVISNAALETWRWFPVPDGSGEWMGFWDLVERWAVFHVK